MPVQTRDDPPPARTATAVVHSKEVLAPLNGRRPAPRGEYNLALQDDFRVSFKKPSGAPVFSLALDTVVQHLIEGRMRMVSGKLF